MASSRIRYDITGVTLWNRNVPEGTPEIVSKWPTLLAFNLEYRRLIDCYLVESTRSFMARSAVDILRSRMKAAEKSFYHHERTGRARTWRCK